MSITGETEPLRKRIMFNLHIDIVSKYELSQDASFTLEQIEYWQVTQ